MESAGTKRDRRAARGLQTHVPHSAPAPPVRGRSRHDFSDECGPWPHGSLSTLHLTHSERTPRTQDVRTTALQHLLLSLPASCRVLTRWRHHSRKKGSSLGGTHAVLLSSQQSARSHVDSCFWCARGCLCVCSCACVRQLACVAHVNITRARDGREAPKRSRSSTGRRGGGLLPHVPAPCSPQQLRARAWPPFKRSGFLRF